MLWALTVLLLFLWVLGMVSGYQVGMWIHILLVLAVASLLIGLIRGRTTTL